MPILLQLILTLTIAGKSLYFIIIKPRKKLLAQLSKFDAVSAKIKAAKTESEFITLYKEIKAEPQHQSIFFINWCYAAVKIIEKLTAEMIEKQESHSANVGEIGENIMTLYRCKNQE